MSNTPKYLIGAIVLIIVVIGAFMLAGKNSVPQETGPIKVGFIGPLTGDASSLGTVDKVAVELAVEEINAEGGINGRPLEVVYEDGKCDSTAGVSAAQKLINSDKVTAIIGGLCSSETSAFGSMAMQNKVVTISYGSSDPKLSELGKYFFRDYPSDSFQAKFAAEYAYNVLGARKVAVMYHISDFGTGAKNVFEKTFTDLGGTIVTTEGAPQTARDYRTQIAKLKSLQSDLVYAAMYTEGSIAFIDQAHSQNLTTPLLGNETWDDPKFQKSTIGKGSFLYAVQLTPPDSGFAAKIKAKTGGDEVPVSVTNAYDATKMLGLALQKGGTDPDKLQAALRDLKYDGVSGHIEFDEHGDLKSASYVVKRVTNGTATVVQ